MLANLGGGGQWQALHEHSHGGGDMSDVPTSLRAKPVNYDAHEQERVEEKLTVQGLDEEMLGAGLSMVLVGGAGGKRRRRCSRGPEVDGKWSKWTSWTMATLCARGIDKWRLRLHEFHS